MTTLATTMQFAKTRSGHRGEAEGKGESDTALLAQVRARQRAGLEGLYTRYASKALGLAFKVLKDRDLAEQVVVDAFWRVWQRAEQFEEGRGSFASWFYGIVRHLAIDELRRREARPTPSEDRELETALAADVNAEQDVLEVVTRRLVADLVHHALAALPPAQRQVLELAYLEGLTREEISKRLGQPLGTVHTRARLGLDKMRVLLAAAM